eukprot:scaffold194423_cov63-Cyclotella_meneghiniana.AAC.2
MSHPPPPPNTLVPNQLSYIQTAINHLKHIERGAPSEAPLPNLTSYYYLLLLFLCRRLHFIPVTPSIHVRRAITWLSTILPHPSVTITMVYTYI